MANDGTMAERASTEKVRREVSGDSGADDEEGDALALEDEIAAAQEAFVSELLQVCVLRVGYEGTIAALQKTAETYAHMLQKAKSSGEIAGGDSDYHQATAMLLSGVVDSLTEEDDDDDGGEDE